MQHTPPIQSAAPAPAIALLGIVAVLSTCMLIACTGSGGQGDRGSRGGDAIPDPATAPLTDTGHQNIPGLDVDTLEDLLPRLYARFGWGPLRTQNQITALHAQALTADDRTVQIRAQDQGPAGTAVQIKIGHFSDPTLEQQFLDALKTELTKAVADAK
ncbi:MAG: hypothetical protein CMJ49_06810 [Planctomycetaceae bacterium]|nr:hypothetical protein [Planctomycetaceae bacterium]